MASTSITFTGGSLFIGNGKLCLQLEDKSRPLLPDDNLGLVDHEACVKNWQSTLAVTCSFDLDGDSIVGLQVFRSRPQSGVEVEANQTSSSVYRDWSAGLGNSPRHRCADFRWKFQVVGDQLSVSVDGASLDFRRVGNSDAAEGLERDRWNHT